MHNETEPMKNICVLCRELYSTGDIAFEQRLIADEDFCPKCWAEIMTATYDTDMQNDFSKIRIPQ